MMGARKLILDYIILMTRTKYSFLELHTVDNAVTEKLSIKPCLTCLFNYIIISLIKPTQ
jgi:hypothetical protein